MTHQTPINTAQTEPLYAEGTERQVQTGDPRAIVDKSGPTTNKAWQQQCQQRDLK